VESLLVATKLRVPAPRSGRIERARLIERLEHGAGSRLVLVSAPAGFGKTSLLTQWLAAVADRGPTEGMLASLVNELDALSVDMRLVLDDYHLTDDESIHAGVTYLLKHLPAQAHLLITTRADPPLPLARLRARGDLVEIRTADLRFTPEEGSKYLNDVMGLELRPEDIVVLEARTEGWIAALHPSSTVL
jgi:LuxR family transcriptional regulator, maltose regulon positive regulatory protein